MWSLTVLPILTLLTFRNQKMGSIPSSTNHHSSFSSYSSFDWPTQSIIQTPTANINPRNHSKFYHVQPINSPTRPSILTQSTNNQLIVHFFRYKSLCCTCCHGTWIYCYQSDNDHPITLYKRGCQPCTPNTDGNLGNGMFSGISHVPIIIIIINIYNNIYNNQHFLMDEWTIAVNGTVSFSRKWSVCKE